MLPFGISEQIYPLAPSTVFDRRTLHDIRARLGLTIPMDQLIAVLDHKLTIHLSLATTTKGHKFVRQTKDGEYHSDGPEGPKYGVLLQNLEGSIRNIIGKHICDGFVGSDETFLRYQMKNDEMEYSVWSDLLPVHELEFILPSREQVLALHHDWYVLPAQDGVGAVFNDGNNESDAESDGNNDESDAESDGNSDGNNDESDAESDGNNDESDCNIDNQNDAREHATSAHAPTTHLVLPSGRCLLTRNNPAHT